MEPQINQPMERNSLHIIIAILVAGFMIAAGIYLSRNPVARTVPAPTVEDIMIAPVSERDHILGNPNAPVVIVEYSDTECPFCKTFHGTMKRIVNEYGKDGQVAWVYRHFPIDQLHANARKEAEASECAAELGGNTKFWEFIDAVFARTSSNGLPAGELSKIADDIGLNVGRFESCLSSGRHSARVQADLEDAIRAQAGGTPYSVVITSSGEKVAIKGAQPYEILKAVIDAALANTPIR